MGVPFLEQLQMGILSACPTSDNEVVGSNIRLRQTGNLTFRGMDCLAQLSALEWVVHSVSNVRG